MHFDFLLPVLYSDDDLTYYCGLASALEAQGARVALLALTRRGARELRKRHEHVFYLYEDWNASSRPTVPEQQAVETAYGLSSLADFVYPEHVYWLKPIDSLVARAVHHFRYMETFLARHSVAVAASFPGANLIVQVLLRFAGAGRISHVLLDYAPFHGRVSMSTTPFTWDDLAAPLPALDAEQRAFTLGLLEEATRERKMFSPVAPALAKASNIRAMLERVPLLFSDEQVDYSIGYMFADRLHRLMRRSVNWTLFEQPVRGERFLFFPLHMPSDSAITIKAPQFERQEALVEYLARRSLPTGLKLYVKPHPYAIDWYSLPMLNHLRSLPNVRLIAPTINVHEMISNCEGVVVITSTAGFESLFHLKPVVVLGRVFYRGYGVTRDVDNLLALPAAISEALRAPPDREAVLRLVHACYAASLPGELTNPHPENLALIARSLLEKAKRLAGHRRNADTC